MFSSTFYKNLDPQYREKLLQIEEIIHTVKALEFSYLNLNKITDFITSHMMPIKFWKMILSSRYFSLINKNLLKLLEYQFYSSIKKLYNKKCDIYSTCEYDFKNFCYPHIDMDKCFEKFERNRHSFVPKSILRNFNRMKLQYYKIKAVEEDDEKWGEAILEVDNEEFIEHNIEFRLGQDLTNKKLWKLYLEYLKSHDQQKLLQAYSKYCRFYLDDAEMLEEYRIAAGDQIVRVPWKNPFDFEVFDEQCCHRQYEYKNYSVVQKAPLKCHFTSENALNQRFPFRSNLMNYIIKNANAFVLHDLFKSCKWFYLKNPVTICYKFEVGRSTSIEIKEQCISVSNFSSLPLSFEKLFISSHLIIAVSQCNVLIPRIYRCTAKYVKLCFQRFMMKNLTF